MDSPVRLMPPCSKCIARAHFGPGSAHLFVCASNVRHASIQPPNLIHDGIPRREFSSDNLSFNGLLDHPTFSSALSCAITSERRRRPP
jgi:hypothetical protein